MEKNQQILGAITNIKVPGIASMGYWSILKTSDAIYFIKSGSALGLGVGTNAFFMLASVVGDVIESQRAKGVAEKDLSTILNQAEESFYFTKDQYNLLDVKEGMFWGGTIKVPNGKEKSWREAGYVKLKLSQKQIKIFWEMLQS